MSKQSDNDQPFPITRWSLVRQASGSEEESREKALEELCRIYWPPVFTFIRSRGRSTTEAEDLTQGFFAEFLSRDDFSKAQGDRGKLRTFLLTAVTRYMSKDFRDRSRQKRGGGAAELSLDLQREDGTPLLEPASDVTPESLFEKQWALTVLHQTLERLAAFYEERDQSSLFEALRFVVSPDLEGEPYRAVGEKVGMSEAAVRIAAHRLKVRYQETLRETIAETLDSGVDVDAEIQVLRSVFA